MDGQPLELLSQLSQVDQHFPTNLSSTPYDTKDMIWNGPFYGKSGPQVIRNPITGGPQPMAPLTTPDHYLAAVNTMVEAKANARANVLRGWNAEQASNEALAKAWGVDPAAVQGLSGKTAAGVIQGQNAQGADQFRQQQEERRTKQGDAALELQRADFQQREQRLRDEDAAKADRQGELNTALEGLPRASEYLAGLPADKAFQLAPGILAPLAKAGSPIFNSMLGGIQNRMISEQTDKEQAAAARDQHMKRIGEAAKALDEQFKPMFADLAKTAPVKYDDAPDATGIGKTRVARYDNALEERLSQIVGALNQAQQLDPETVSKATAALDQLRDMSDKRAALNAANERANVLSLYFRKLLEQQKAGLQADGGR